MMMVAARARLIDLTPARDSFLSAVLSGLALPQKSIAPKYFYDATGARLFEAICETPEYYPTRTEIAILSDNAAEIAQLVGPRAQIVEYGSGNARKVRLLLDALSDPVAYMPVDISGEHLHAEAEQLARDYPAVEITAVVADITRPFPLPAPRRLPRSVLGLFMGSSIGNFTPEEARAFLAGAARLLRGGKLLIGVDLKKDEAILNAAYNDAAGVTAAFNLNLLDHINRELGADFDRNAFAHRAFYNAKLGRIEMHLVSQRAQQVHVGGQAFSFAAGETIHTENSYKYTIDEFRTLASRNGWTPVKVWTDPKSLFSVHLLKTG
jgi:dimethylhistidine N-methyltransferase